MEMNDILERPAIEGLAYLADASVEDCMQRGARWTLVRSAEHRRSIAAIMVVRRLGAIQNGFIGYGKAIVGWANAERAGALGDAIDRNDVAAAVSVLDEWVPSEHEINVRVVAGLLAAFSTSPST
jgi:hypothetical protein